MRIVAEYPPLGYPGGPCQVMERIRDNVRNPKVQDSLVDTVEDGSDLTNAEASKVYSPKQEPGFPGVLIKNIRFSAHAQYRMDLRQVTVPEVKASLGNFLKTWNREKSMHSPQYVMWESSVSWGESIRWEDPKLGLAVAFTLEGGVAVIITSFWTRSPKAPRVDESSCSYDQPLPAESYFRTALKSAPTPGVQTFVTDKSQENLPTGIDREKETVLPPGSATPGSGGREIPRTEYNTPDSGSNISERPRTVGVPGEEYGVPYKEDYNTISRRTMTAGVGCESEHSWAWIPPSGEFIEVHDHGDWALTHLTEAHKEKIRKSPEIAEAWKYSKVFYPELLEALFETALPSGPPKGLSAKGLCYLDPSTLVEAGEFPTLRKGWWDPFSERLNRAEERFLAQCAAQGKPYTERLTVRSTKVNALKKALWEHPGLLYREVRQAAKNALLDDGWLVVSNALAISWHVTPNQKQYDSFFRQVLQCWKAQGIRPDPDVEEFSYSVEKRYSELSFGEALDLFASRRVVEDFYEYLLDGPPQGGTYAERRKKENAESWALAPSFEKPSKKGPQKKFPPKPPVGRLPYRQRRASSFQTVGPEDDYEGDPWELAQKAGINILSDKDFQVGFGDEDGVLVAALFDSSIRGKYSFDIAVLPEYQSQGLGKKLLNIALGLYSQNEESWGDDSSIELDVVSPIMERLLKQKGFVEFERDHGHVIMTRSASARLASMFESRNG